MPNLLMIVIRSTLATADGSLLISFWAPQIMRTPIVSQLRQAPLSRGLST